MWCSSPILDPTQTVRFCVALMAAKRLRLCLGKALLHTPTMRRLPSFADVKVLLVLAILHKLKRVSLLAVVANGGGQPRARAALALCVLEHLGVTNVPVGIGSVGVPSAPQPHEYALAGIAGADARLERGHELLLRTIRGAPPKSVRVVNISSLRDMADIVATDPAAVLASVHTIAIQGGLESDPNSVSGWRPDTSVNNGFDLAAATHLHAFCFANELRMTVTSRFAVPLLPMQLAKSFATRTSCPVMRYLADAQSLGLEGLWVKLCEGRLPARCTKQVRARAGSLQGLNSLSLRSSYRYPHATVLCPNPAPVLPVVFCYVLRRGRTAVCGEPQGETRQRRAGLALPQRICEYASSAGLLYA